MPDSVVALTQMHGQREAGGGQGKRVGQRESKRYPKASKSGKRTISTPI